MKNKNDEDRSAALFNLTVEQYRTSQEVKDGYIVRACSECGIKSESGNGHRAYCSQMDAYKKLKHGRKSNFAEPETEIAPIGEVDIHNMYTEHVRIRDHAFSPECHLCRLVEVVDPN